MRSSKSTNNMINLHLIQTVGYIPIIRVFV